MLHNLNLLWPQKRQGFSAVEMKEGRNYLFKNTSRVVPSPTDHGVCDINIVDLWLPLSESVFMYEIFYTFKEWEDPTM